MESHRLDVRYRKVEQKTAGLCSSGKYTEASKVWEAFLTEVSNTWDWALLLRYAEACISQLPSRPAGYFFAGTACLNLQNYQEAYQNFSEVLELHPGHPAALKSQCEILYALDRYKEALESAQELLRADPLNPEYIKLAASNMMMIARWDDAFRLINKGLAAHPEDCELLIEKALGLQSFGNNEGAKELFIKAEKIISKRLLSPDLIHILILIHLNRGGILQGVNEDTAGRIEQEMGHVLIELNKSRVFENRSN
jgi:tetratricopeptide (TPR) repeat protein